MIKKTVHGKSLEKFDRVRSRLEQGQPLGRALKEEKLSALTYRKIADRTETPQFEPYVPPEVASFDPPPPMIDQRMVLITGTPQQIAEVLKGM